MKTIQLAELSEPVRSFLSQVDPQDEIVVRDESGHPCYIVRASAESSDSRRAKALRDLAEIQERVGESMRSRGLTEEDLDRAIREDD